MTDLLKQLKKRRLSLGLRQRDMLLRAGISRQQYQRLEARGNPRLDTLALIAEGLESDILLIPKDKRQAVLAILEGSEQQSEQKADNDWPQNPWQGLLDDTDE